MDNNKLIRKLYAFRQNPELYKAPSNEDVADLVILVLNAVKKIEDAVETKRVNIEAKYDKQAKDVLSSAQKENVQLLERVRKEVNDLISRADDVMNQTTTKLESQVQQAVANLRNGENGIVTEQEIQRAAEVALSMLELPDFDTLVMAQLTSNGNAIRDALELLSGDDRYKVQVADVEGLAEALNQLAVIRTANGGTIGKQQVYGFIRQALADGTITTGGASTLDELTDVDTTGAILNDVLTFDGTDWVPAAAPGAGGGEANTITNLGTGEGVYSAKVGVDLKLKSIKAGTNVTLSSDANEVTINATSQTENSYTTTEKNKLAGIEAGAEVNNISDANATDLTDGGNTTLHTHSIYEPAKSADDNYVTDAEKTKLSNLSGTNSGDNAVNSNYSGLVTNATHTGDVTGATALTIAAKAVTLAKMDDVATGTVFYRKTALTGVPEVQTLATLKTDLGLSNTNSGDQTTIAGITGTKSQFDTAVTDGNFMYVGDAPTSHTHALSEVVDSTSEALGVGTLEVGHASDTTISRVSAGVAAIEGNNILTTATGLPLAGGTMTGNITLAENTSIALDPAGSADGKYSGITVTGVSGYSQAFGDLVTLDKDDSRWEAVDISVAAAATGDARGVLGMVVSAGTDGNACTILLEGIIRADANFPALTIGANVYASTTGDIVVTQPTTTDHVIRIVGSALTADEVFFRPDFSWITHT